MEWLFNTASSPEFWKSLVGFSAAGGIVLSPEQSNAIIAAGLALMSIINAWKHVSRNKPR